MAKLSVCKNNIKILEEYKNRNGLRSVTHALHEILDNHPLHVEMNPQRGLQEQLKEACKV